VEEALRWAANMKWKGFTPIVELVETVYQKGVKLFADELAPFSEQWQRAEALPKWDITIVPT
jgi:predicted peroxiredoxin